MEAVAKASTAMDSLNTSMIPMAVATTLDSEAKGSQQLSPPAAHNEHAENESAMRLPANKHVTRSHLVVEAELTESTTVSDSHVHECRLQ